MIQLLWLPDLCLAGGLNLLGFWKGREDVSFSAFSVEVRSSVYDPNLSEDINRLVEKTLTDMGLLRKGRHPSLKFEFSFTRFFRNADVKTSVIIRVSADGVSWVYLDEIPTVKDRRALLKVIRKAVKGFIKNYRKAR